MERIGYTLPEYWSVSEEELTWHAAKLAEEAGEVCQAVCKRKDVLDIAEECIDAMQCLENILRHIGITDGCLAALRIAHVEKDAKRGYIREEGSIYDETGVAQGAGAQEELAIA